MQFEEKAQLISAESKPFDFNGNKGTSHKLRFNIGGEIFVCRSSEEQISQLKSLEGESGNGVFKLSSPKESLKLECEKFTA